MDIFWIFLDYPLVLCLLGNQLSMDIFLDYPLDYPLGSLHPLELALPL